MPKGVYIRTEETRRKIGEARKGKHHSRETKEKIKLGNLGKKCSEGTRKKISKAIAKVYKEGKSNQGGYKLSRRTKKRMSKARKGKYPKSYYQKLGTMGYKKLFQNSTPTSIEVKLYNELKERGLLFEKQRLINGRFVVDAYIPRLNLVIEADGDYWHGLEENIKRDKTKNAYLTKCGYNLLRLTETEINNGSFRRKLPNA